LNSKPGFGTPDLKVSGDFHSSFTLKNKSGTFTYGAKVPYLKYITPRKGNRGYDEVFGLDPKNTKIFLERDFIQEYNDKIRQQLQI
jgi:hypothetical protein